MEISHDYVKGTRVPKSLIEPLGHLMIWFALLEQNVDAALGIFLDLEHDRGQLMAAQFNSIRVKMDLIELLAKDQIVDPEWKTAFADVMLKVKAANSARNEIIHGNWTYSPNELLRMSNPEKGLYKHSITRDGKPRPVELNSNKIMLAAEAALDAAARLEIALQTMKRIMPEGWPPRLPTKSDEPLPP